MKNTAGIFQSARGNMSNSISDFLTRLTKVQNMALFVIGIYGNLILFPSFFVWSACKYNQLLHQLKCCSVKAMIEDKIEKRKVTKDFDIEKSYYLKIKLPPNKETVLRVKEDLWEIVKKGEIIHVIYQNGGKIKEVINKKAEIQDYVFGMVLSGLISIYLLWTLPIKKTFNRSA